MVDSPEAQGSWNDDNYPPGWLDFPVFYVWEGEELDIDLEDYAYDPEGDQLGFVARSLDPDIASGSLLWSVPPWDEAVLTLTGVSDGRAEVEATVSDNEYDVSTTFEVVVRSRTNRRPVWHGTLADGNLGWTTSTVNIQGLVRDPDGDPLTFTIGPAEYVWGSVEGWDLSMGRAGGVDGQQVVVTITASDGSLEASTTFVATLVP